MSIDGSVRDLNGIRLVLVEKQENLNATHKVLDNLVITWRFYFPDTLCSRKVLTTELIDGVPVDKCADMDIDTREHICKLIMQLCLKELFEFRYMQTDPNWANFFYNQESRQVMMFLIARTESSVELLGFCYLFPLKKLTHKIVLVLSWFYWILGPAEPTANHF